jgi:hypothetical protein
MTQPSKDQSSIFPTLRNWFAFAVNLETAEPGTIKLCGDVYGHPDYEDGTEITTSRIVKDIGFGQVATESGSIYKLVDPDMETAEKQKSSDPFASITKGLPKHRPF